MSDRYIFPGFTPFLSAAEAGVTDPVSLANARRQPALRAVATACAQATDARPEHAPEMFAHALNVLDGLAIAHAAAFAITAAIASKLGLDPPLNRAADQANRIAELEAELAALKAPRPTAQSPTKGKA